MKCFQFLIGVGGGSDELVLWAVSAYGDWKTCLTWSRGGREAEHHACVQGPRLRRSGSVTCESARHPGRRAAPVLRNARSHTHAYPTLPAFPLCPVPSIFPAKAGKVLLFYFSCEAREGGEVRCDSARCTAAHRTCRYTARSVADHPGDPPDPISNSAVKPRYAGCSAGKQPVGEYVAADLIPHTPASSEMLEAGVW